MLENKMLCLKYRALSDYVEIIRNFKSWETVYKKYFVVQQIKVCIIWFLWMSIFIQCMHKFQAGKTIYESNTVVFVFTKVLVTIVVLFGE